MEDFDVLATLEDRLQADITTHSVDAFPSEEQ